MSETPEKVGELVINLNYTGDHGSELFAKLFEALQKMDLGVFSKVDSSVKFKTKDEEKGEGIGFEDETIATIYSEALPPLECDETEKRPYSHEIDYWKKKWKIERDVLSPKLDHYERTSTLSMTRREFMLLYPFMTELPETELPFYRYDDQGAFDGPEIDPYETVKFALTTIGKPTLDTTTEMTRTRASLYIEPEEEILTWTLREIFYK